MQSRYLNELIKSRLTNRSLSFTFYPQFVEPILSLTSKDKMTPEMVLICQQNIFSLLALESRHEPISLTVGHQPKGVKKDKLYRLIFAELAALLAGANTPEHKAVLHSVLAHCQLSSAAAAMTGADKMEIDLIDGRGDSCLLVNYLKIIISAL